MTRVKELLDSQKVIEYYGYKANRAGFISCPFHKEKTASFKVYSGSRGWHCFGCSQSGSIIDFVMKLFGINYSQAIIRLNYDFNLGLSSNKPDPKHQRELIKKKLIEQKQAEIKRLIYEWHLLEFKKQRRLVEQYKPVKFEDLQNVFVDAIISMNDEENWLLSHEGW